MLTACMRCSPSPQGTGWPSSIICGARAVASYLNHRTDTEQTRVATLLRQWSVAKDAPDDDSRKAALSPGTCLHPAELAFEALKGADAAVADVLVAAASAADCDLHLALVSIKESGSAEHIGYYGSRRRRWSDEEDEEDFEVSEVHDRHETLSDWRRPDGSQLELGALPFMEDELCPPDAFEDLEPDEQYFHEATGEGASFERTYRRAALVLWPRARAARRPQPGGSGRHSALPGRTDRALDSKWRRSASPLWRESANSPAIAARVAKAGRLVSREDRDAQRRRHGCPPGVSCRMRHVSTLFWTSSPLVLTARATTRRSCGPSVSCRRSGPRRCSSTSSPARPRRT